jgi:hypothetical protein
MEMKFYKNASILLLVTSLLFGCGGNKDSRLPAISEQSISQNSTRNSSESNIAKFKSETEKLIENIKSQKNNPISLSPLNDQYKILKEQKPQPSFLEGSNGKILDSLNKLDTLDPKKENSPNVKYLQESLGMTGELVDGQYGSKLSTELLNFLEDITKDLDSTAIPSVNSSSTTSKYQSQNNSVGELKIPNFLIISSILGATLSVLSLGLSSLLFLKLNQSKIKFKELDKKVREHREDLKKWISKIDQNIKVLSAQQSEIDRKSQQQRQQSKGSAYPEPAQVYGEREQFGYEETFNPSSAPSPSSYVSKERATYPSTPKAYQAPQSPYEVIAQQYNTNPNSIGMSAQGVSETEDSIYRRRRDASIKQVTLQSINNYGYWIITDTEGIYWLTPIAEPKLNPMNFDTFQALFHFNGEPLSGKLQLIKPAKVTQVSTSQWELIDRGEVQFI